MAITGLSKLVFGKYKVTGGKVTYTDGAVTEKLASYAVDPTSAEDNNLYLDNEVAETEAGAFTGGTYTVETGDLSKATSLMMLKLKEVEVTYKDGKTATELVFDDSTTSEYLGVGQIEMHQVEGVPMYRAVWLTKVKFNIPAMAAKTKGTNIEWQLKTLTGTLLRSEHIDDEYDHPWMMTADFETEEEALEYLLFKAGATSVTKSNEEGDQ